MAADFARAFFCHECNARVNATRNDEQDFECDACHSTFVEEQEPSTTAVGDASPISAAMAALAPATGRLSPAPVPAVSEPAYEAAAGAQAAAPAATTAAAPAAAAAAEPPPAIDRPEIVEQPDAISALVSRLLTQYLQHPGVGRQGVGGTGGLQLFGPLMGASLASDPRDYASGDGDYAALLETLLQQSATSQRSAPASAAALQGLPSRIVDAEQAANGEPCAICTEALEEGQQAKILPCGHSFHEGCVVPWLTQHSSLCPVCRASVEAAN